MSNLRHAASTLLVATLLSACIGPFAPASPSAGQSANPSPTRLARGNVTVRLPSVWAAPNPGGVQVVSALPIVSALYDTLVALTSKGEIVPYLAESWTSSPNSVTFKIRKGATCADGRAVTPTVVANSLKRTISLTGPWASFAWGTGPYTVSASEDAGTVTFSRTSANGDLIYGFAFYQAGSIVCDAGLTAQDADFAVRSYGSGPYVIESVKPQEQIVLKRRPEWSWGPLGASANDPGFPETLTFLPVTNETTAANLLITGGLDLTSVVGPDIKRLRQDGSFIEMSLSGAVTNGMGFNMGPSHVTSNIAVRRAISAAVDPKAYALAAYDGEAEVVRGYYAPTHPCYDPNAASLLPTPPGDLDKARAILLADGYSLAGDGKLQKNGKPLAIALIASSSTGNGPEYVTEQLNKMGATATLNLTSDDQHRANLFGGSYDVFFRPDNANLSPSGAVGLTPNFHPPLAPTGRDFFYLDDPVLTGLFEKAGADPTCNGWKEWQRRVLTQAYYMPLVVAKVVFFGRRATYTEGSTGFGPVAASIRQRP